MVNNKSTLISVKELIKTLILTFIIYIIWILIVIYIFESQSMLFFFMNLYDYPTNQIFNGSDIINYTQYYNIYASYITFTSPLSDWTAIGFFFVILTIVLYIFNIKQKGFKRDLTLLMVIVSFIIYLIWLIMGLMVLYYHLLVDRNIFVITGFLVMIVVLILSYYLYPKYLRVKGIK